MRTKTIIFLILAIVFVAGFSYFIFVKNKDNKQETTENALNLLSKVDSQAGISFTVTPLDFSLKEPIKFKIAIDTHSGSLDFDLTEISLLEDDKGGKYQPISWDGSSSGGHHRSGVITFPELNNEVKYMKLTIKDDYNAPARIFEWNLE